MDNQLMIDNWTLEELCHLLLKGPSVSPREEIAVDSEMRKHHLNKIPRYVIQFDALLQTLTHIVLRDGMIVDDGFTRGWDFVGSPLRTLRTSSLLQTYPFLSFRTQLDGPRRALIGELCVTDSLRDIQKQNEEWWERYGKPRNNYFSMVLWGGAGMLARSHVFETPYTGHPLRQSLIKATSLVRPHRNVLENVLRVIQTERIKLFQHLGDDHIRTYSTFNLPPVALEVITNTQSIEDLIPMAIQLRDKYSKLRKWLKTFEVASNAEDTKKLIKYSRELNSVAKSINGLLTSRGSGSTNLTLGVSWLKFSWSGNPLERLRNSFGVRATLTRLILAPQGEIAIQKLLKLFGEEHSRLGRDIYKNLVLRHSGMD